MFDLCTFDLKLILETIFPIFKEQYWYITAYVLLLVFDLFFGKHVVKLEQSVYKKLIIFMTVALSAVSYIIPYGMPWNSNFLWVLYLYLLGAYIGRFGFFFKLRKTYQYTLFSICFYVISYAMTVVLISISQVHQNLLPYVEYFCKQNDLLILLSAIMITLFIRESAIQINSRAVKYIAGLTMGVYMLHTNDCLKPVIYSSEDITRIFTLLFNFVRFELLWFVIAVVTESLRRLIVEHFLVRRIIGKLRMLNDINM